MPRNIKNIASDYKNLVEEFLIHTFLLGALFVVAGLFIGSIAPVQLVRPALIGVGVLLTATILAKISLKYRDDLPRDGDEEESN